MACVLGFFVCAFFLNWSIRGERLDYAAQFALMALWFLAHSLVQRKEAARG